MHAAALDWIARHATTDEVRVLDVGGRQINGTPRDLFPHATEYVVVDLIEHPSVDIVADVMALKPTGRAKLSVGRFDVIVYAEVAEHAKDWRDHLDHMADLLVDGGRCIITAANERRTPHSGIDGGAVRDGEHYANLTAEDLDAVLYGIGDNYVIDEAGDDLRAVFWKG